MITPEQLQQYRGLSDLCKKLEDLADSTNVVEQFRESLDILLGSLLKKVIKCDTSLPLMKDTDYPRGKYQLRSYGIVKGRLIYTYSNDNHACRYYQLNSEDLYTTLQRDGLELAKSLIRVQKNKNIKDSYRFKQLIEFVQDCTKVNFQHEYKSLTKKYYPTTTITMLPNPLSELSTQCLEDVRCFELVLESGRDSLRGVLKFQSGEELTVLEEPYNSEDVDEWVSPSVIFRLDLQLYQFLIESLTAFYQTAQKKFTGEGSDIKKLVDKYGQYIVLEKLDESKE